jgi:hypothetical protein
VIDVLKKFIVGLQWLDGQISAPGFRVGMITGAAVTAAAAILLWAVL